MVWPQRGDVVVRSLGMDSATGFRGSWRRQRGEGSAPVTERWSRAAVVVCQLKLLRLPSLYPLGGAMAFSGPPAPAACAVACELHIEACAWWFCSKIGTSPLLMFRIGLIGKMYCMACSPLKRQHIRNGGRLGPAVEGFVGMWPIRQDTTGNPLGHRARRGAELGVFDARHCRWANAPGLFHFRDHWDRRWS